MVTTTAGELSYRISAQDDATKILTAVNDLFLKLRNNISNVTPDIQSFRTATKNANYSIEQINESFKSNSDTIKKVTNDYNHNKAEVDSFTQSIKNATTEVDDQSASIKDLATKLIALGASLSFMKNFASSSLDAAKQVESTKLQLNAMAETFNYSGKSGIYAAESVDAFRESLNSMSSIQAKNIRQLAALGYDVEWVTEKYSDLKSMAYIVGGSVADVTEILGGSSKQLSTLGITTTITKEDQASKIASDIQSQYRMDNNGKTLSREVALAQARAQVYSAELEAFQSTSNNTYAAALAKYEEIKAKFKESVGKVYTTILSPILSVATSILDFIGSSKIITWIVALGGALAILIPTIAGMINVFGKLKTSIRGAFQVFKLFRETTFESLGVVKAFKSSFGEVSIFKSFSASLGSITATFLRNINATKAATSVEKLFGITNIATAAGIDANTQAQMRNDFMKAKGKGVSAMLAVYEKWRSQGLTEETIQLAMNTEAQLANNAARAAGNKTTLTSMLSSKLGGIMPTISKSNGGIGILATLGKGLTTIFGVVKSLFGFVGNIFKLVVKIFRFLGPIGWVITGIIALIAAIKSNFAGIGDLFKEIWEGVKGIFTAFAEPFKEFFGSIKDGTGIFGTLANIIKPLINLIRSFFAFVMPIFQGVAKFVGTILVSALKLVWGIISGIFEVIGTLFGSLFGDGQDALDGAADTGQNILDGITYVCDIISDFMDFIMPAIKAVGWVIGNIIIAPLKAVIDAITSFLKWLGVLSDEAEETEESMDKTEKHLANSSKYTQQMGSDMNTVKNVAYTSDNTSASATTFGSVARNAYNVTNTASLTGTAASIAGNTGNSYYSTNNSGKSVSMGDTYYNVNITNANTGNPIDEKTITKSLTDVNKTYVNEVRSHITY